MCWRASPARIREEIMTERFSFWPSSATGRPGEAGGGQGTLAACTQDLVPINGAVVHPSEMAPIDTPD